MMIGLSASRWPGGGTFELQTKMSMTLINLQLQYIGADMSFLNMLPTVRNQFNLFCYYFQTLAIGLAYRP